MRTCFARWRSRDNSTVQPLEEIKARIESMLPGARIEIIPNAGPSQQLSLLIGKEHAASVARFLRDDAVLQMDFCSNVTGVEQRAILDEIVSARCNQCRHGKKKGEFGSRPPRQPE